MNNFLSEDEVKKFIVDYYNNQGFITEVAWGHSHGIDIVAKKKNECVIIEVKGCGSRSAMRRNYFLSMLGEILQRMDNPNYTYYIAAPKIKKYQNLWDHLPTLAKERTKINMILVDGAGQLEFFH